MSLDATPGGTTSNSFVDLDTALAYQVGRPGAVQFQALDTEEQEALLIWATQDIALAVKWSGAMVSDDQALPLPMVGQKDAFGRALPLDIIPPLVQQATALYALVLHQQAGMVTVTGQSVQHLKDGDTEVWYSTSTRTTAQRWGLITPDIWNLLRPYGTVPVRSLQMPVFRG